MLFFFLIIILIFFLCRLFIYILEFVLYDVKKKAHSLMMCQRVTKIKIYFLLPFIKKKNKKIVELLAAKHVFFFFFHNR